MAAISGHHPRHGARRAQGRSGRLRRDFGEVEHLAGQPQGPGGFRLQGRSCAPNASLYDELLAARPGWGFVHGRGGRHSRAIRASRASIVDPLDGTSNFLHGIPHFAISHRGSGTFAADGKGWGDMVAPRGSISR
jgi:myo-inositol-1(or 4)-monophosphatase